MFEFIANLLLIGPIFMLRAFYINLIRYFCFECQVMHQRAIEWYVPNSAAHLKTEWTEQREKKTLNKIDYERAFHHTTQIFKNWYVWNGLNNSQTIKIDNINDEHKISQAYLFLYIFIWRISILCACFYYYYFSLSYAVISCSSNFVKNLLVVCWNFRAKKYYVILMNEPTATKNYWYYYGNGQRFVPLWMITGKTSKRLQ